MIWIVAGFILLVLSGVAVLNAITFPRMRAASPAWTPTVSVLIPARDEAAVIGETVRRLLEQEYPAFEVIVLDDESADGTGRAARTAGGVDERLKVIEGKPLPTGWGGKNWACQQLAETARGDVLLFTDADVRWEPGSLGGVIALMAEYKADMLTVWPTQHTVTWGERLVVPLMALAVVAYLPELAVRLFPWPVFAAANGQCLVFRRDVYEAVGQHAAVRLNVVEDIALGQAVKRRGARLVMADGNGLIGCRMYSSWPEVREGFAKNILAGHANSPAFLAVSTLFHWSVFVAPWIWLALGWALPFAAGWPVVPLALIGLGVFVRGLSAAVTRQRVIDAVLMPVSVVLMTIIAVRSLGPVEWKGRRVQHKVAS
ncbi:MAG: glycosyltransferase [Chloroflexi bacterium]|nr:glycosyltransferase [Chloroflexota bacterium]